MSDVQQALVEIREIAKGLLRTGASLPAGLRLQEIADELTAECEALRRDAARLDYIERTFSAVTTQERYLPLQMIWGKGCNGRTLREAIDAALAARTGKGEANG